MKVTTLLTVFRVTSVFLIVFFPELIFAQEDQNKFELTAKDIEISKEKRTNTFQYQIVTASRLQETSDKAPANVQVITEEQIRLRAYRSLLEVLRDLTPFKIDDAATEEWWHNVTVNGVERQDKIVVLLDGLRISSPTNELIPYLENYPPQLASQIEIIYGPASALYGADAMTCVINIITKESNQKVSANFMPFVGTHGAYGGFGQVGVRMAGNRSLSVGGQYSFDPQPNLPEIFSDNEELDMSGQETGTFNTDFGSVTPQRPVSPEYEAPLLNYAAFAKLKLSDFNVSVFHNYSEVSTSSGVKAQNTVFNAEQFVGQYMTTFGAQYSKSYDKLSTSTTFQANWYEMNPLSNFRNLFTGMETGYKYAQSNRGKLEQQLIWKPIRNLSLTGGASFERFFSMPKTADLQSPVNRELDISGFYLGTELEMKIYSITYNNLGFYGQVQYSPSNKVHFTLGSRYDRNSRFGGTFNPRLGLVVQPTENTTFKALYGSAFLAPLPFYSHGHFGNFFSEDGGQTYRSGFIHAPNPELGPLKLNNFEVQAQHILSDKLSVRVNGFYTMLAGLFLYVPDEGNTNLYNGKFLGWDVDFIETITNANEQQNWGGGLRLDYSDKVGESKINAWAALNYTDGRQLQQDGEYYPVGLLSEWQYRAGVDYRYGNFTASVRLIAMNAQRLDALKEGTKERQLLPGYYLLNTTLRYEVVKKNAIFIDIRNLTNNSYTVPSRTGNRDGSSYQLSEVPQWPLRIFGGVQLEF